MRTLKIEGGIGGGSMCLAHEGKIFGEACIQNESPKNDYLIEFIDGFLVGNDVRKSEIAKIIYSSNPGSATGLKIISAAVRGFAMAHNIELVGKNLFACIAEHFLKAGKEKGLILLPAERNNFQCVRFGKEINVLSEQKISNKEEFYTLTDNYSEKKKLDVIFPFRIFETISPDFYSAIIQKYPNATDLGSNLSVFL